MNNKNITFEEFMKLLEKEKGEAYKKLSDEDKFKARLGQNPGGTTIGYKPLKEGEKEKYHKEFIQFLKEKHGIDI